MQRRSRLLFAFAAVLVAPVRGQELQELTLDAALQQGRVLRPPLPRGQWLPDGKHFSLVLDGKDGEEVHGCDPTGTRTLLFDAGRLATALTEAGAADVDPRAIPPFTWLDPLRIRIERGDGVYEFGVAGRSASRTLPIPRDAAVFAVAPGDERVAFVRAHDLWLGDDHGGERRVTEDGSEDVVYGRSVHREEFGITNGLFWDPSGRFLAFYREDLRPIEPYPYIDYRPTPPKALPGRYPMAGRKHSIVRVCLWDTHTRSRYELEHDDQDLYWTCVTFAPGGRQVCVALVNRAQDHVQLVRFDSATGKRERVLVEERDPHWLEPNTGPQFVPDGSGRFLWFSNRDGFRHLYLHDADGTRVRPVTRGRFDVLELTGYAHDLRSLFVVAAGPDPRQRHLFRAGLRDEAMTQVTRGGGTHEPVIGPLGDRALDCHRSFELPGAVDLLALDDQTSKRLWEAPDPRTRFRLGGQRSFEVEAGDGTKLYGQMLLPPGMDETRRHPVLLYVYGGPQSQLVRDDWLAGANAWVWHLAARGMVVAWLDNRGTNQRGIAFAQAVHRRLGELEVADQLAAVAHLRSLPFVDPKRIGVHGWSFGGYLTLMLLCSAPKTFACGVAGAPVTDWAQYETGWTERYLDTPAENPDGYARGSAVRIAGRLADPLLLLHGTDDRTVMLSHSMSFAQACTDAGTLFEMMLYPMQRHGLEGTSKAAMIRLATRFLVERLQP